MTSIDRQPFYRKRTSREAAQEMTAYHLASHCAGLLCAAQLHGMASEQIIQLLQKGFYSPANHNIGLGHIFLVIFLNIGEFVVVIHHEAI